MNEKIIIRDIKFEKQYLNDFSIKLINEYLNSEFIDATKSTDKKIITSIFYNRRINSFSDFDDDSYYTDFNNFAKVCKTRENSAINRFYIFLIINNYGNFLNISEVFLTFNTIFNNVKQGFRMYIYDRTLDIPNGDKWLLNDNGKVLKFDFSSAKNEFVKNESKSYIWTYLGVDMSSKSKHLNRQLDFLNSINIVDNKFNITAHDIVQFKNQMLEKVNRQSAFVYISNMRTIIKFLEANDKLYINSMVFDLLSLNNTKTSGKVKAYNKEEVEQILNEIDKKSKSSDTQDLKDLYRLIYIVINMILHTSMRLATILDLTKGCLVETVPGSYCIIGNSKITVNDKYNITKYIKDLFDETIMITSRYRTTEKELFILKRQRNKGVVKLNREQISNYLKVICNDIGIDNLGVSGFRNRFMQDVTKYVINNGAEQSLLGELSKHSLNIHYKYYFDNEIEELCYDLYGVNIGDIPLKGRIIPKNSNTPIESTVQNGCGYCSIPSCHESSCLDCLMCKEFITTPAHIEYFKNEINEIDKLIIAEQIQHEKEFLITKKRLYVKYLAECIKIDTEESNYE